MKLAAAQIFPQIPHLHNPKLPPPSTTHHPIHKRLSPLNSNKSPSPATKSAAADDGIPIEHVKTLVKFKSRHNYIRVIQVSRAADHPLAGSRLLLLDAPGNIHSISYIFKSLTNAYFDVFATLPPILPPGPLAILGFGAGSAARLILELYPEAAIRGWELDPSVLAVAREYFGLEKLEKKYSERLKIYTGNALNLGEKEKFAGILIDLFSKGCVIPELQDAATWEKLRRRLSEGGRMMVNVGGSCVEPEDIRRDGSVIMEETLRAMYEVFPGEVFVLSLDNRKDDSAVAMTGRLPDAGEWRKKLPRPVKFYVDMWQPYRSL
ncbi:uncharacterized protein LOC131019713 [Salvia miltiorrhiza]|uniref:uncharacterized protein LOC131019713 n=1 Tax=Salvia miltiorrhiza TaxID=226208 RepID=UPI0025ACD8C8|nr:uncharacterized protein LOC131019713 [Salvia miltiorrhiza]